MIQDVFVKPSVRRHELVVDYTLGNESDADVRTTLYAAVEDAGQEVPAVRVRPVEVSIPAAQDRRRHTAAALAESAALVAR